MYCVSGGGAVNPLNPGPTIQGGTGTTSTAPGLTTVANGDLVIFYGHNWDTYGGASPPTGSTPTFSERSDAGASLMYFADGILSTAGATGDKSHGNLNVAGAPWQAGLVAVSTVDAADWAFIGKGTGQAANNAASLSVPHPGAGETTNNLLVIIAYSRDGSLRTPDLPSGWSEAARYDGGSTRGEIAVFYRLHPGGSPGNVTVTFSGAGGTGVSEMAQMAAFSGNDTTSPLGDVGADSNWAAAQNIGPITAVTLTNNHQLLLVIAGRQQDMGTNGISNVVATLSGDSQTWQEIEERGTTLGTDAGYVWDYAFTTGTPSITNKTFTNSNTQTAAGCGMMVAFKPPPSTRRAQVSWAELETPLAPRRSQVSWAELEVPTAPRRAQVSWGELEVPDAPRRAQVSWAELETPLAPRRAQVSWGELEVPDVDISRRAQVSWAEWEVPDAPRRAQVSWAEWETPDAPRRAQVSWAEWEAPLAPRRAQVSWAELEVPESQAGAKLVIWLDAD